MLVKRTKYLLLFITRTVTNNSKKKGISFLATISSSQFKELAILSHLKTMRNTAIKVQGGSTVYLYGSGQILLAPYKWLSILLAIQGA